MKYLSITILFLIFFSQPLLAEIWDFGLGIVFVPGRMENYDPAQIEIGASSVKGYGLSVSKQATKSFENLTKEEKIVEDPFSRDLLKELAYRQNLSSISFYSLDSLKLVATLQLPVNDQNLQKLKKKIYRTWGETDENDTDINEDKELKLDDFSQNLESISSRFVRNLAVVQLPESEDQIILYEGQQVGSNKGVLKSINKSDILFIENNKEIILEISK